jgi:hypothetical protein
MRLGEAGHGQGRRRSVDDRCYNPWRNKRERREQTNMALDLTLTLGNLLERSCATTDKIVDPAPSFCDRGKHYVALLMSHPKFLGRHVNHTFDLRKWLGRPWHGEARCFTFPTNQIDDDPVEVRLVASLNRPGGNLTGVANLNVELGPKRLELLREAIPTSTKIALLINPNFAGAEPLLKNLQAAARTLGRELHVGMPAVSAISRWPSKA